MYKTTPIPTHPFHFLKRRSPIPPRPQIQPKRLRDSKNSRLARVDAAKTHAWQLDTLSKHYPGYHLHFVPERGRSQPGNPACCRKIQNENLCGGA